MLKTSLVGLCWLSNVFYPIKNKISFPLIWSDRRSIALLHCSPDVEDDTIQMESSGGYISGQMNNLGFHVQDDVEISSISNCQVSQKSKGSVVWHLKQCVKIFVALHAKFLWDSSYEGILTIRVRPKSSCIIFFTVSY